MSNHLFVFRGPWNIAITNHELFVSSREYVFQQYWQVTSSLSPADKKKTRQLISILALIYDVFMYSMKLTFIEQHGTVCDRDGGMSLW